MRVRKTGTALVILTLLQFVTSSYAQSSGSSEPSDERSSIAITGIPSDIEGIDLIITCDPEAANRDYVTETFSSIPLTDTYALERGVDRGLVFLVYEDMRQIEEFVIPHEEISSVVQIRYDMDVYDRTDVVFTQEKLVMVHSSTSNAGMFTRSDVFVLPYPEMGFECMNQIHSIGAEHERQLDLLCIALLFYCRTVVPLNQENY